MEGRITFDIPPLVSGVCDLDCIDVTLLEARNLYPNATVNIMRLKNCNPNEICEKFNSFGFHKINFKS